MASHRFCLHAMKGSMRLALVIGGLALGFGLALLVSPDVSVAWYGPTIETAAGEFGVDARLVQAVVRVESSGRRRARSRRGAVGLMQLLPSTARQLAQELELGEVRESDLEDAVLNIRLGTYYLSKLGKRFEGDITLVLAAYNAGPSKVSAWRREHPELSSAALLERVAYPETRRFVGKVMRRIGTVETKYMDADGTEMVVRVMQDS